MNNKTQLSTTTTNLNPVWLRLFGQARTRILIWYLVLMAFFVAVAIPTIRQRLFTRVENRVRDELTEEVEGFRELLTSEFTFTKGAVWERLQKEYGVRQSYSNEQKLSALFDVYLSRELTEDDTFLITFINGRYNKASSRALPELLRRDSEFLESLAKVRQPVRGEKQVPDPSIGSILYKIEPVNIEGKILGVLIVAHVTAGERAEALEAFKVVIEVKIAVLALALVLSWFAAGKVLSPLQLLTATARSISESDLTRRIPTAGEGEIAELAKTFNEMMDRLETAFASQRNFINDAGHELRTPITIIRGHLELMGDDPDEQQETRALVMDELDRMSRFVDDLILLAKAERPDFLLLETVDVAILTEELFAKATALAQRNWQLDGVGKGSIVADRQRLTQAVMNLAQNATQHTGNDNTISLGSKIVNGKVHFWVRDTGEGIEPSDQQRIFQRFARAANSRRRSEGAGLGLSIVQAIAQSHGGQIHLQSQPGTGSTFIIVLPLEPPQEVVSHASNSHR
ncbi:MAG: HAMP domain-containing sensor histidine kinase [Nostocaceae cyanobacterium]|nr:HAMP domain-containing sensor histidine kinase [Nostocaceae cyanobacterium]